MERHKAIVFAMFLGLTACSPVQRLTVDRLTISPREDLCVAVGGSLTVAVQALDDANEGVNDALVTLVSFNLEMTDPSEEEETIDLLNELTGSIEFDGAELQGAIELELQAGDEAGIARLWAFSVTEGVGVPDQVAPKGPPSLNRTIELSESCDDPSEDDPASDDTGATGEEAE